MEDSLLTEGPRVDREWIVRPPLFMCSVRMYDTHTWVNWWLLRIVHQKDGETVFMKKGAVSCMTPLKTPDDAPPGWIVGNSEYDARGHFKKDGCAEAKVNIHVCSKGQWEDLWKEISSLRILAHRRFGVPENDQR